MAKRRINHGFNVQHLRLHCTPRCGACEFCQDVFWMIDLVTASALALPKVELHCHLLGIISPALLARIQRENGPILVEPATLAAAYPVHDYLSFQRWIEILKPYQCATPDLMRPILASYVEALIAQNVVYVEIMLSLTMFPGDRPAMLAGLHRWREWANEMEQGRIQIEFVFVLPRTLAPDLLQRDTETLLELHREDLAVGVALVGLETGESIERFRPSFIRFQEAGLGIEIHAGEHAGSESVWDACEMDSRIVWATASLLSKTRS